MTSPAMFQNSSFTGPWCQFLQIRARIDARAQRTFEGGGLLLQVLRREIAVSCKRLLKVFTITSMGRHLWSGLIVCTCKSSLHYKWCLASGCKKKQ